MHVDARHMENHSTIEGDLCIIGAGAAGISLAREWMHSSFKVILLEGGGFDVDDRMQDLFRGKNTGQRYYPLQSSRLHLFGGTTAHWAGFCSPLDPIDFEQRAWVPNSGWPIRRQDLDSYYRRANKIVEIDSDQYSLPYWQQKDPDLVSLPFDSQVVWNKIWQFSPPTRFGSKYRQDIVGSRNVHLYTYANVVHIEANEQASMVQELIVKNLQGKEHRVRATHYVLACCAIQNARLLLSSNNRAPRGLGNDHDLVGRYFMDHLEVKSADLYLPAPTPLKLYVLDFFVSKVRAELAVHENVQRQRGMLNGTCSLSPKVRAKNQTPMIDFFPDNAHKTVAWMEGTHTKVKEGKVPLMATSPFSEYELFTRIEQSPNPSSRVFLDEQRDALGVPRANLNWQLTPLEKTSIRSLYELIGQQAGLAEVGRVRLMEWLQDMDDNSWPSFLGGGWHHMGTTRMQNDPTKGVVDANCRVHNMKNLFVAGSSCFATSGAPNPTLTLIALTLRLSDHLKSIAKTS
jgi:choline dehydrogenase-like flavoprotein